jgi:hypothetical protein
MIEPEIMDLTLVCQSFPELIDPQISRDNILDNIDAMFRRGSHLVKVKGTEGFGKTTLLAQFCIRHPNHALSFFIKPTSRWAYDPEILRFDLCNQLNWVLYKKQLKEEKVEDTFLRSHLMKLQRFAKGKQDFYYFVVDGLHDIPEQDVQICILDLIPLGLPGFRFLVSEDPEKELIEIPKDIVIESCPIPAFGFDETLRYMDNLKIDKEALDEIYQTCRGVPGYLASVKRILQSGTDIQELLREMPNKLPDLFEIEWRRIIGIGNDMQSKLLAILAHDRKIHTVDNLARFLGIETSSIHDLLQDLRFVIIDPQTQKVSFVSESFHRFASDKLQHLKKQILDLLIDDLMKKPDSNAALTYLPGYFEQTGRFEDLLNYLSPDHFANMLESSQSLVPIQQNAELGLNIARNLKRDGDLMRFSIQKSAMLVFNGFGIWHSEIEARMALNDYDSAVALAQNTILKEERLLQLAIIARAKCEQGLSPEPVLMEQIQQLYRQIDTTALSDQAIEIASNLIYCAPDLAMDLVERFANTDKDENSLDLAFAKLSIAAISKDNKQIQPRDTIEDIRSRIKDPKIRSFSATVSLLLSEYSAAEVIADAEKLEGASNRLFLLRLWSLKNPEREDAVDVIDYALNLAISTTAYAPNAQVFCEIATPLPFILDKSKAKQLVSSFDGQNSTIESLGPTKDYVKLRLLLAQTEIKYDIDIASDRITDIYFYIRDLSDIAIKAECMALLVASLIDMDPNMQLETKGGIHSLAQDELKADINHLLDSTAEHYGDTRIIVSELARTKPDMAVEVVESLNTETRRNMAYIDLVESATQIPIVKIDFDFLEKMIDKITYPQLKDEALLKVIERLSIETDPPESITPKILPLFNRIKDIQSADDRCRAYCIAHSLLMKQNNDCYSGLASHFLYQLNTAWQSIDLEWHKTDIGFMIVKYLAAYSFEKAREYLKVTEKLRDTASFDGSANILAYLACLQLAIRAYSSLLSRNIDNKMDIDRLKELIDGVPSNGARAVLWAEVALRYVVGKRIDDCKRIVAEYVKPSLHNISFDDKGHRNETIIMIAPALYCAHKTTAFETILELPISQRDKAYGEICDFILCKQIPSDPYENSPGQCYDIIYEEIVDICEILELMDHDGTIYHYIECISDSLCSNRLRDHFSRQQKSDIANRLESIINIKLPNPRHIKHNGYKIAAQAQIVRIRPQSRLQDWQNLVDSAEGIPNISDRSFVLSIIATSIPRREETKQKEVLAKSIELIEQIPVAFDKIMRYKDLAYMMLDIDNVISKQYLKIAMQSSIKNDNLGIHSIQRQIIDLAHRLDTNLAASLASLADDDPAREETRIALQRRKQLLDLRKKMGEQSGNGIDLSLPKPDYASAAWMLLGSLNSNRTEAVHIKNTLDFIQIAADLPINQSYPILAWAIENIKKRYEKTDQATIYLRPIFEAMLLGAELSGRMAKLSSLQLKRNKYYTDPSSNNSVLIRSGDREKAKQFIRDWFENNILDYLKICDPYFGPDDLDVLQILSLTKPGCKVYILTSRKHQEDEKIQIPWEAAYRDYWRIHISDQDPPDTEIIIVGTEPGGKLPIHDRWWLTNGGGIRIGTSFNSLGLTRDSEISILTEEEAEIRDKEIDKYVQRIKKEHDGIKLSYSLFTL